MCRTVWMPDFPFLENSVEFSVGADSVWVWCVRTSSTTEQVRNHLQVHVTKERWTKKIKTTNQRKLFSPTGFSQISPSVLAVQGLALSPATSALSRYAQKPESLGSPGNHCSVLAVKGDMSSHPQYETFIFLRPTQGVSFCKREKCFVHVFFTHTHTYMHNTIQWNI